MKTAISIPDALFDAADRAARKLHLSRSELYARALTQFLSSEGDDAVTARLDELYGEEDSRLAPELAEAQRESVARNT